MQILNSLVPEIYGIVKQVIDGSVRRKEGISLLAQRSGINDSTAGDFIHMMRRMLDGKRFTRNSSAYITEYFLVQIRGDYGEDSFQKALTALEQHINYYSEIRHTPLITLKAVYNKYRPIIPSIEASDEQDQDIIATQLNTQKWSKERIVETLKQLPLKTSQQVTINGKRFSRDNYTIALLKKLRGFKCQICGTTIQKKDGSFYIEAAHIISKRERGQETPSNILILCPNHHKEFDYGQLDIMELDQHKPDELQFMLNGKLYSISLALE